MRPALRAFLSFLIFVSVSLSHCVTAYAASLSVSLSVGLTYFQVQGYTSPGALVVLKESGSVVGTATSSNDGSFTITVSGYDGTYTYTLYATDVGGKNTESLTTTVSLTPGNTTTLSGLVLPPTYSHNGLDQELGQDLVFSGMGVPNSYILLVIDSTTTQSTLVGADGRYNLRITTDFLSIGTHQLILKNQLASGATSDPTLTLALTIRSPDSISTNPSSSPLAVSPVPSSFPRPWWLAFFDLNQDGHLSLSELSNVVSKWLNEWLIDLKSQKGTCDLNHDLKCNLTDLSILLYYIDR